MTLINVFVFIALKILHSLAFVQKSLFSNSADICKIPKIIPGSIVFILNVLSAKVNVFIYSYCHKTCSY